MFILSANKNEIAVLDKEVVTSGSMNVPLEFNADAAPPSPFTYGQDGIFTAIRGNGETQDVSGMAVNLSVPTRVSQLNNDRKFQTKAQVSAAIAQLEARIAA